MAEETDLPINIPMSPGEYIRVLKLTRKPSKEEFGVIAKVAGAGILLIGFIGFIIYLLITVMPGWFKS